METPMPASSTQPNEQHAITEDVKASETITSIFSDPIQILVGDNPKPLIVYRSYAIKVPFFEKCLEHQMQKSLTGVIRLPEEEVQTVEDLFCFLYFGGSSLDKFSPTKLDPEQTESCWEPMLNLYHLAEKFDFEVLHNALIDHLLPYISEYTTRIATLQYIEIKFPLGCLLGKLLALDMVRMMQEDYETIADDPDFDDLLEWVEKGAG